MKSKRYGLFAVLSVLLCILFIYGIFRVMRHLSSQGITDEGVILSEGWDIKCNNDLYRNQNMGEFSFPVSERGDTMVLTSVLPDAGVKNPVMVFHIRYTDLIVSLDGKRIFSYGRERYNQGLITGSGYIIVPLPDDYAGKTINIFMRIGEDLAFSSVKPPLLANSHTFYKDYASRNLWPISTSLFLIIFSIILLCMTIFCIIQRTLSRYELMKLIWMAFFSGVCGFWVMCTAELTELFTDNIIFKVYLEYTCIYTVPFFFMCYHTDGNDNSPSRFRRYTFRIIAMSQLAFIIAAGLLQGFRIINMPSLLLISQILDVITLVYVLTGRLVDLKKHRGRSNFSLIGTLVVAVFALADLVIFNYSKFVSAKGNASYEVKGLYIAIIFFVSSLLLDYVNDAIRSAKDRTRAEVMSRLAYTDALTGINNRQAAEEYFDHLDEKNIEYCAIEFDLNELKKVNDSQGHEEGDEYIKSFAEILKKAADGKGFIGRIGGDEFIAILSDENRLNGARVENFLKTIVEEVENENKKEHIVHMSVAYGRCYSYEDGVSTVRQALKVADRRMYDTKTAMKKGRR